MAGCGQDGPGVETGLNLAGDCLKFLIGEDLGPHHSPQVELHGPDSSLPQSTKVGSPFWTIVSGHSVVEEVLMYGRVCLGGVQELVQLPQLILGSNKVGAVIVEYGVWSVPSGDKSHQSCNEG